MTARVVAVLAVLAATAAFAWWWRRREGRIVEAHGFFERADVGLTSGERPSAVLIEFSGEGCAPCVTVGSRLEKLAEELPDLRVVTIDAGERLDLADRYHVRRVPTVFVTDPDLRVIWRASGVVGEDALREALLGPDWAGRPHPVVLEGPQPHLRSRGTRRRLRRGTQRTPARPPA